MLLYKALILLFSCAVASPPAFPPYSQQCQDDAGPPWMDDSENFGNGFYWTDSHARAVLNEDGSCPTPLESACRTQTNPLQAFVEGPLSCPTGGWFCRIYRDPNHGVKGALNSDVNFADCDVPSGLWEDTNNDQSGHCHGGVDPSSYYWWVRDHWHRPYSGRMKCCCDWPPSGVANRCDYRAVVPESFGAENCRDANEDHDGGRPGSGFLYGFEDGCPRNGDRVAWTYEPEDAMCWEVLNFGLPDEGDRDDTIYPSSTGPATGPGRATRGTSEGIGNFSGPRDGPYVPPSTGTDVTVAPGPGPQPTRIESTEGVGSSDDVNGGGAPSDPEVNDEEQESESNESALYYESNSPTCTDGSYLISAEQCEQAGSELGYDELFREISTPRRPRGCFVKGNRLYFNRDTTLMSSTDNSRTSICAIASSFNFQISMNGMCESEKAYITDVETCEEAGEVLGLDMRRVFSNEERLRGCYTRNGRLFFNRDTTMTSTDSDRQSICMVQAAQENSRRILALSELKLRSRLLDFE